MSQEFKVLRPQIVEASTGMRDERDARNDEIDLFDLWDDIVSHKSVLVAVFFVCLACSLAYLYVAKPVYQVESVIKPSGEIDLVELNVPQLNGVYSLAVPEAFEHAKRAVLSKESQRLFYSQNLAELKKIDGLYSPGISDAQNESGFSERIGVQLSNDKKDAEKFIKLSLELPDGEAAANVLNSYVSFVLLNRLEEVKRTVESKVSVRLSKLEYNASLLRDKYYSRKVQRKLQLDEASKIASSIGQVEPIYSKSDILGSFEPPLYMYGTKALSAEEIALAERGKQAKELPNGEEHFIAGLSEILFEIEQLKKLNIDYSKIKIALVDEYALVAASPIKPKKLLIVLLACVLGVFLGILGALMLSAYKRHVSRA